MIMINAYTTGKDIGTLQERVKKLEDDIRALKGILQSTQAHVMKQLEEIRNAVNDERSRAEGNV